MADTPGKVPKVPTVKLGREHFEAVWWIARVEGKSPAEVLQELCGAQSAARFKRYTDDVAKLKKLDSETAKAEAQARKRSRGEGEE